ncbi:MAG: hypothetical protein C0619_07860 [Desulfuromonas sp.]|nr:MAG: hypothetical protein C0619_07860 [Desulfuromonas sp.]
MKKFLILLLLVLVSMPATAFAGADEGTGLPGSKHDINLLAGAQADVEGRVCAFCHTPHHAIQNPAADYLPLWSHELNTSTSFSPYATVTLDANIVDPFIGPSRLCMSCHDGVIAADQHYAFDGAPKVLEGDSWGELAIGTKNTAGEHDFSNDHPIGFELAAAAAADDEIFTDIVSRPFIDNTDVIVGDVLTAGFMTCATCHDVHNTQNATHDIATTPNYFVYAKQDGSSLCLTCHDKGDTTP